MDPAGDSGSEHRKRRRRRGSQPPVAAKLFIDERAKGETASLSADLFDQLFGPSPPDGAHHIAVTPWVPPRAHADAELPWTLVAAARRSPGEPGLSISVPATSLALQSFGAALRAARADARTRSGFDVLAVDARPIGLAAVYLRVDGDALRKHDEVQRKFGGGFVGAGPLAKRGKAGGRDDDTAGDVQARLVAAARAALAAHGVVHAGDHVAIPLPAHPITHAAFPPAEVTICEPVDQGLVGDGTEVVLDLETRGRSGGAGRAASYARGHQLRPLIAEEEEDTANDSFYSAAEGGGGDGSGGDGALTSSSDDPPSTADELDSDLDGGGATTDDSGDEMISLSSPMLAQASGILSARTAATPRPYGAVPSGVRTPGSVFSSHTVTTARPGSLSGRSFQIKPLCARMPDGLLHPRPSPAEDDEARVFVDIKVLARLGCFSGDWVKITAPREQGAYRAWSFNELDHDEAPEEFRVAKIYGLQDVPGNEPMQYPKTGHGRRFSLGSVVSMSRPPPSAYVPPILFANLGQPASAYISALSLTSHDGKRFFRSKLVNSAAPPLAKELTLLRVPTPVSLERTAQTGLFASLKQHFERRRRLLRSGDLIAVSFQPNISRALSGGTDGSEQDSLVEEFLAATAASPRADEAAADAAVAWFKVGQITVSDIDRDDPVSDQALWGEMALVEPMETKMTQVGRDCQKVPAALEVPWPLYYGTQPQPPAPLQGGPSPIASRDSLPRQHVAPARRRLRELLAAATSPQAKLLGMAPTVVLLHSTHRHVGKTHAALATCADLGLHACAVDAYDVLSEGASGGDVKTDGTLRARLERALECGAAASVPVLQHVEALTADRTAATISELLGEFSALVMTATEADKVSDAVRGLVTHELELGAPDEAEREGILADVAGARGLALAHDVDLGAVALRTAALVAGDLVDVVERAAAARLARLEAIAASNPGALLRDVLVAGGSGARGVARADLDAAVEATRKNFADSIGAPKIPNVTWDDVGGLAHVKDAVVETIQLPLERPELFARGMKKRSGILFYGPPGTGKTLLAKAIATEFSLNFFSVKGPELLNMYIGESEANVRRVFQKARDARPCVVFFDELDSVAPKRGNQGDSGGVMDRIVSQLLAELDGMSSGGEGVFVIGATNRPDLLDQALLRPGRFDKMLYLGVADDHTKQLTILEALTRKFAMRADLDLRRVASALPLTYTGADMYALCSDAMLKAVMRQAAAVDAKIRALPGGPVSTAHFFDHLASDADTAVEVAEPDFDAARRELVASVSAKELEHYRRVRELFEGRAEPPANPPAGASSSGASTRSFSLASTNANADAPTPDSTRSAAESPRAPRAKGKGKAPATGQDDDEDDDDAYVTSNDFGGDGDGGAVRANGSAAKGKGRARTPGGFGDAAEGDEDELYG